jgi:hypothetical protein
VVSCAIGDITALLARFANRNRCCRAPRRRTQSLPGIIVVRRERDAEDALVLHARPVSNLFERLPARQLIHVWNNDLSRCIEEISGDRQLFGEKPDSGKQ